MAGAPRLPTDWKMYWQVLLRALRCMLRRLLQQCAQHGCYPILCSKNEAHTAMQKRPLDKLVLPL